ncbi:hypothetical protein QBC39DRAFT_163887 [Podospora conica]|nr:hypothetical protein QBC39DRAFT_163887 [Schizothecium conicum]
MTDCPVGSSDGMSATRESQSPASPNAQSFDMFDPARLDFRRNGRDMREKVVALSSRLLTTPAPRYPRTERMERTDRGRDGLSQAAQQAATGNHRTPHLGRKQELPAVRTQRGVSHRCQTTTSVMITAKAWLLVPSDRPGEFRPSCWASAREALFSSTQAFLEPLFKPLPSLCCLHRRAWTAWPGNSGERRRESHKKSTSSAGQVKNHRFTGPSCTRRPRAPPPQHCASASDRLCARTLRPSGTDGTGVQQSGTPNGTALRHSKSDPIPGRSANRGSV